MIKSLEKCAWWVIRMYGINRTYCFSSGHVWVLSHFSRFWLFATLWSVAFQAPLSTGFSRQEYWNGLPCPPPGNLPNSGIEPKSLKSPALVGGFFTIKATWEALSSGHAGIKRQLKCELIILKKRHFLWDRFSSVLKITQNCCWLLWQ